MTRRSRRPDKVHKKNLDWPKHLHEKLHSDLKDLCKEYYDDQLERKVDQALYELVNTCVRTKHAPNERDMDSLHQKFVRLLLKKGHQDPILMAQELVLSLIDAYNEAIADKALESILAKREKTSTVIHKATGDVIPKTRTKIADTEIPLRNASKEASVVEGREVRKTREEIPVALMRANVRSKYSLEVRIPNLIVEALGLMSGQSLDYRVEDHKAIIFSPQLPLAQGKVAISQRAGGASLGIIIPADACREIGIAEDTFLSIKLSGKGYFGLERAAVNPALEGLLKRTLRKKPISVKTQV